MEWSLTLVIIALFGGATVFAGWKSGRPQKDSLRPRWISWQFIVLLVGTALVFAVIHMVDLMGLRPGAGATGKFGP